MKRRIARWVITLAVTGTVLTAATTAGVIWWYRAPALSTDPRQLEQEILRLRSERDSLQEHVVGIERTRDLLDRRPTGDVLLALPTPFVQALARDIMRGWFSAVDVHLRNLTVQKAGDVKASLRFFGRRNVGRYTLRLSLADVQGRLASGTPRLTVARDAARADRIDITLPVRLEGGTGRGTAQFTWDATGLANGVCKDVQTEQPIEGTVAPAQYEARGYLRLRAATDGLRIIPTFPDLSMRLMVKPSARSVAALETLLTSQGRLCNFAVEKAGVEARILELVGRGFEVRIPQRFFRAVRVPIAIDGAVPIAGTKLLLSATPDSLVLTPQAVWLSARVAIKGTVR
ncbi:MAG: hypothetical protein K2R93_06960 [Gemmatimonadaceae bacterium]|nr:hypothetical protein [Gemmatimonadaceae bacterium]